MHIHKGHESIGLSGPVVTLGIFDGVHMGHRVLLDRLISVAREIQGEAVVITFSPHPRMVLEKDNARLTFLSTSEEKIELLSGAGVDHLVIMEFTREFSRISACDFVRDVLVGKIGTKHLIVGYDHHFGRRGEGDFNTIAQCPESKGFSIEQVEGVLSGEGAISSSMIRESLLEGRLDEANRLLGYDYQVTGTVIEGRKIGHSLGFPTANIRPCDQHKLIPKNGVYAVEVKLEGNMLPGMLSIGSNPTVNSDESYRSIEVHILNFDRDIYGKEITVIFRKRIRDEIRFPGREKLTEQMNEDMQTTLRILKIL